MVYYLFSYCRNYLVLVFVFSVVVVLVSVFSAGAAAGLVVSAAGLAGPAAIVSAGAGAGEAGAAVADDVEVESVVLVASVLLLPQEATKRPIESASTLNFTNFIIFSFLVGYTVNTQNRKR